MDALYPKWPWQTFEYTYNDKVSKMSHMHFALCEFKHRRDSSIKRPAVSTMRYRATCKQFQWFPFLEFFL